MKFFPKNKSSFLVFLMLFCVFLSIMSCSSDDDTIVSELSNVENKEIDNSEDDSDVSESDNSDPVEDGSDAEDTTKDTVDEDSGTDSGTVDVACGIENVVFKEENGLLVIQAEDTSIEGTDWELDTIKTGFTGDGYLVWNGANSFGQPGKGILTYKVRITNVGTYRFEWVSRITIGSNGTEHNDSWLKIADAKHFYGKRNQNGHIVYPVGTQQAVIPESAGQNNTTPRGSSKEGWFKVYMNNATKWHWQSSTSDNDAHDIFVVFDTPGDYTIEISGRSNGHGIDKFVLFNIDNVNRSFAISEDREDSKMECR